MAIDINEPFWKEWTDKNNADIWGAPDESKPDQLKKVIAKACDWIRGQGKDPEEVARLMLTLGQK